MGAILGREPLTSPKEPAENSAQEDVDHGKTEAGPQNVFRKALGGIIEEDANKEEKRGEDNDVENGESPKKKSKKKKKVKNVEDESSTFFTFFFFLDFFFGDPM